MTHQVLLFYKYVTINDPEVLRDSIRAQATALGLRGRCLIAEEGINGTFEGETEQTELFVEWLLSDPRFADISMKRSEGTGEAFSKLVVKVRPEIVGTRFPKEIDPRTQTGKHLTPEELRAWYEQNEDFVVIDMRNDYEFASGHFRNSVNPGLENSRDLPDVLPKLAPYKEKKVVTVCTGGVRCEKMSAYLLANGFSDVHQLQDGMHGYMEKYPGKDFDGTLYTFDKRLVMDFGGERTIIGKCYVCDAQTEQYTNCANNFCHRHFLACDACLEKTGSTCSKKCKKKVFATTRNIVKRVVYGIAGTVLVVVGAFFLFSGADTSVPAHMNTTYSIDGTAVTLVDGVSDIASAPGSASSVVTRYFGNELYTDLNSDGKEDVAFLVTQERGGSGTFFYVVAALATSSGYVGSDGYLLGDRIAPQNIIVSQNPRHVGVIVANYATRAPGEPFSTAPSVGASVYLKLDTEHMQWGVVEPDFEGESR